MAVEVDLTGNGVWGGGKAELSNYSVEEEATPLAGGDSTGAISAVTFGVVGEPDSPLLYDTGFTLRDGSNGVISGAIATVDIGTHAATLTGDSILAPLVPDRQLVPREGTLRDVIVQTLRDAGVTANVLFDESINTTQQVAMAGWYGSGWDWLKMVCQTFQIEVSVVGSNVLVREPRTRESTTDTDSDRRINITRGEVAKSIEIIRYENKYKPNDIIYPAGGWSEDLEIYSVAAGEVVEVEVPVNVSIMSIEQPTCVQFVPRTWTGGSVYAVAGNDGLPIPPAMWASFGGKVEASIGADTRTIILKITGMTLNELSPYTLSVNSGSGEAYSALRLRGSGVHFNTETLQFPTGADTRWASTEIGITIDNPTIQTLAQVGTLAMSAARTYSAPVYTLSATASVVNRTGEAGFVRYLTFEDFDNARSDSYTFDSFKTEFAGKTFGQIRDTLRSAPGGATLYENQAFGNVVGSMIRHEDTNFRIRRATITDNNVSYEAQADTTFAEVKKAMSGKTFAEIKTLRSGRMFSEIALTPLRNT